MSRSLLSTAASICVGSLLLLGCQPTESGSSSTTAASTTTTVANNSGDGDGDGDGNQGGDGDNNGGNTGDGNASTSLSCDALRAADARLTDLSIILGNLTQPVLDQARSGDAGGLDPRTIGKTMGVMQPLAEPGSEMAAGLAALQPVLDLLSTSLQPDVALSPTALADLQAGGGIVAAAAEKLHDALKDKCPKEGPKPAPTTTVAPVATEAPTTTEAPVVTETPATTEAPVVTEAPTTTEAPATTEAPTTTAA
jgi:hypothetical protein